MDKSISLDFVIYVMSTEHSELIELKLCSKAKDIVNTGLQTG